MLEKDIIAKVKNKNIKAQRLLYDQYKAYWYRICLRYNSDVVNAQDVMQNALIKIFSNIGQFDSHKGDFKSWSSKIIVNENLMFFRKNKSNKLFVDVDECLNIESDAHTPIEELSTEAITELIQQLPDGYRIVFNMYVFKHLISEINQTAFGFHR